jgi:hypothetical protein
MLADMKRAVMRELQSVKTRPRWFELMRVTIAATLWRPVVAAALLLLVFGALTIWVFVGRKASTLPTEATATSKPAIVPEQIAGAPGDDKSPSVTPKERGTSHDYHPRGVRRRRSGTAGSRQALTQIANSHHEAQPPSLLPVDSERMLRIEIQTGDPSIRIIWFAPEEVDSQQTNP